MKDRRLESESRSQKLRVKKLITRYLLLVAFFILFTVYYSPFTVFASEISARAAIVIDSANEKILYAKNPHLRLPPASTAKLVTAMVVLDRISPEAIVTISVNAANTPSVSPDIKKSERYTVKDLLYLALMRSVNGATVALAEAVAGSEKRFARMMNNKVAQLALENTKFINSSGLPGAGQYTTAFDLARIMKESLGYPLIKDILNTRTKEIHTLAGREILIRNTNNLLWENEAILGGKTGYTRAAGHCFVCAENNGNNTLISVVLGETRRDSIWKNSTLLLSRGHDVLNQRAEPMIYFSGVEKRPVVFASYESNKKYNAKKQKKPKKPSISRREETTTVKRAKKPDINNKQTKTDTKNAKKPNKNIPSYSRNLQRN